MVPTADGAIVFRRSDGHFRRWGARSDRACLTIGLAALRMGELPGVPPELPADFHILPDD